MILERWEVAIKLGQTKATMGYNLSCYIWMVERRFRFQYFFVMVFSGCFPFWLWAQPMSVTPSPTSWDHTVPITLLNDALNWEQNTYLLRRRQFRQHHQKLVLLPLLPPPLPLAMCTNLCDGTPEWPQVARHSSQGRRMNWLGDGVPRKKGRHMHTQY